MIEAVIGGVNDNHALGIIGPRLDSSIQPIKCRLYVSFVAGAVDRHFFYCYQR